MIRPNLGVVLSAQTPAALADIADRVRAAWPEPALPPRIAVVDAAELVASLRETGSRGPAAAAGSWDVALIASDPTLRTSTTAHVLDALRTGFIPAVCLAEPDPGIAGALRADGVVVRRADEPIERVAAMLYGLAERQPEVRALGRQLRLMRSFEGEAAVAMDRLHDELLLAAKVQRDFLPAALAPRNGMASAVMYRPAGFVSGDIYDIVQVDEHRTAFFLADAMGHGVPAALMTLFLTCSFPKRRGGTGDDKSVPPGLALARLNTELTVARAGPTRYATAIAGVIDESTGVVTIASAGHPPPVVLGPRGMRTVEMSGLLLGVMENAEYEEVTIQLADDEILLIHSDGLDDALRAHPGDPGAGAAPSHPRVGHLADILRGFDGVGRASNEDPLRPASVIAALGERLDSLAGSLNQIDDVTVLAIACSPRSQAMRRGRTEAPRGAGL